MKVKFLQTGGATPAPETNQQNAQAGAEEQLAALAKKLIQELGQEAAAALVQILTQMLQSAPAPQEQAPVAYQRKGGKLIPVTRK